MTQWRWRVGYSARVGPGAIGGSALSIIDFQPEAPIAAAASTTPPRHSRPSHLSRRQRLSHNFRAGRRQQHGCSTLQPAGLLPRVLRGGADGAGAAAAGAAAPTVDAVALFGPSPSFGCGAGGLLATGEDQTSGDPCRCRQWQWCRGRGRGAGPPWRHHLPHGGLPAAPAGHTAGCGSGGQQRRRHWAGGHSLGVTARVRVRAKLRRRIAAGAGPAAAAVVRQAVRVGARGGQWAGRGAGPGLGPARGWRRRQRGGAGVGVGGNGGARRPAGGHAAAAVGGVRAAARPPPAALLAAAAAYVRSRAVLAAATSVGLGQQALGAMAGLRGGSPQKGGTEEAKPLLAHREAYGVRRGGPRLSISSLALLQQVAVAAAAAGGASGVAAGPGPGVGAGTGVGRSGRGPVPWAFESVQP